MAKKIQLKYLPWIEARRHYHLSDAHIQMARELVLLVSSKWTDRKPGTSCAGSFSPKAPPGLVLRIEAFLAAFLVHVD